MPRRVAVLYDGFNFYYGLRKLRLNTGVCLYWQNMVKLSECIVEEAPDYQPGDVLSSAIYFTATISHADDKKRWRQKNYFQLLKAQGFVKLVMGQYQIRDQRCDACDAEPVICHTCGSLMQRPQEKQTDVNLALYALVGAIEDKYDDLIIVTADSDLAPAARMVHQRYAGSPKRVYFAFPPCQPPNSALISVADDYFSITEYMLQQCLMKRVETFNGQRFSCPAEWMEGDAVR